MDERIIDEVKQKHGEVFLVAHAGREFLFRRATRGEWKRFRTAIFDERKRADALEQLVRSVIVHPSAEDFDAMLEKFPALGETIGEQVTEVAGGGKADEAKKL